MNTPCSVEHNEFKKVNLCLLNKMKESFINILRYEDYMSVNKNFKKLKS